MPRPMQFPFLATLAEGDSRRFPATRQSVQGKQIIITLQMLRNAVRNIRRKHPERRFAFALCTDTKTWLATRVLDGLKMPPGRPFGIKNDPEGTGPRSPTAGQLGRARRAAKHRDKKAAEFAFAMSPEGSANPTELVLEYRRRARMQILNTSGMLREAYELHAKLNPHAPWEGRLRPEHVREIHPDRETSCRAVARHLSSQIGRRVELFQRSENVAGELRTAFFARTEPQEQAQPAQDAA